MRVLVCGGRDFVGYKLLKETLEDIYWKTPPGPFVIIEGGAIGADFLAKVWVHHAFTDPDNHLVEYKADWKKHGKAAGPIRNQQMLDEGKPDVVIAFPGGTGTADMIARAKKANVKVIEVK